MTRLGLPILLTLLASGCIVVDGDPFGGELTTETARLTFDGELDTVTFDVGSGTFELRQADVDVVTVERTTRWRNEPPVLTAQLEGGTLTLSAVCEGFALSCGADHVVLVPLAVMVEGETGSGDIHVTGASEVDLATGSGSIQLSNVAGDVFAESGSGDLTIDGAAGDLVLETGSGSIRGLDLNVRTLLAGTGSGDVNLSFTDEPLLVDVATGSGSVGFDVPSGEYDIDLATGSGSITLIGVVNHEQCEATLRAETGSGDIRVIGTP